MDAGAQPLTPRQRRFRRRIFLGVFLLLLLWFAFGCWLYFWDELPPNDSDLDVPALRVPQRDNGLVQIYLLPAAPFNLEAFAKSRGLVDGEKIDALKYSDNPGSSPILDAFLAQARPAFTRLDAVLALPQFESPGPINYATALPATAPLLNLATALRLSARQYLEAGDYPAAAHDIRRLRLLATRLVEDHTVAVNYLVANTIAGFATKETYAALNDPALPLRQQTSLAGDLVAFPLTTAALQRSLLAEYQFVVSSIDAEKRGALTFAVYHPSGLFSNFLEKWRRLSLQPNTTRREVAADFRAWHQAVDQPYATTDFSTLENLAHVDGRLSSHPLAKLFDYLAPNYGGRYAVRNLTAVISDIVVDAYTCVAADRLLSTGFALRRYFADQGALPTTLAALAPQYLPEVPVDPFDGLPLRYDPARGLVYSVGTSLKDQGSNLPPSANDYPGALVQSSQPTLILTFQNPPPASPHTSATLPPVK